MKKFLITVDTEGDNLWNYHSGDTITTKNALYLPRFQQLCERFHFIPTYLTNYEMAVDPFYREFALDRLQQKKCEIGMHLHAWNSPPLASLGGSPGLGNSYLIEYPLSVMRDKILRLTEELETAFQQKMTVHRAGRWATNQAYFDLLVQAGYRVDCSVTPHVSWQNTPGFTQGSQGSDYSASPEEPYWIECNEGKDKLLEIPVTIRRCHYAAQEKRRGLQGALSNLKHSLQGKVLWFRPTLYNRKELLHLLKSVASSSSDYMMFMIHSSELMPGGSPTFQHEDEIDRLYDILEEVFACASLSFAGSSLESYAKNMQKG